MYSNYNDSDATYCSEVEKLIKTTQNLIPRRSQRLSQKPQAREKFSWENVAITNRGVFKRKTRVITKQRVHANRISPDIFNAIDLREDQKFISQLNDICVNEHLSCPRNIIETKEDDVPLDFVQKSKVLANKTSVGKSRVITKQRVQANRISPDIFNSIGLQEDQQFISNLNNICGKEQLSCPRNIIETKDDDVPLEFVQKSKVFAKKTSLGDLNANIEKETYKKIVKDQINIKTKKKRGRPRKCPCPENSLNIKRPLENKEILLAYQTNFRDLSKNLLKIKSEQLTPIEITPKFVNETKTVDTKSLKIEKFNYVEISPKILTEKETKISSKSSEPTKTIKSTQIISNLQEKQNSLEYNKTEITSKTLKFRKSIAKSAKNVKQNGNSLKISQDLKISQNSTNSTKTKEITKTFSNNKENKNSFENSETATNISTKSFPKSKITKNISKPIKNLTIKKCKSSTTSQDKNLPTHNKDIMKFFDKSLYLDKIKSSNNISNNKADIPEIPPTPANSTQDPIRKSILPDIYPPHFKFQLSAEAVQNRPLSLQFPQSHIITPDDTVTTDHLEQISPKILTENETKFSPKSSEPTKTIKTTQIISNLQENQNSLEYNKTEITSKTLKSRKSIVKSAKVVKHKENLQKISQELKICQNSTNSTKTKEITQTSSNNEKNKNSFKNSETATNVSTKSSSKPIKNITNKKYKPSTNSQDKKLPTLNKDIMKFFDKSLYLDKIKSSNNISNNKADIPQIPTTPANSTQDAIRKSILPDIYPPHFKFQLSAEAVQNRPLSLQFPQSHIITPDDTVTTDHLESSSSSPSLPESLCELLQTKDIKEILDIDKVSYRLYNYHVQALALILNLRVEYLSELLDKIMKIKADVLKNIHKAVKRPFVADTDLFAATPEETWESDDAGCKVVFNSQSPKLRRFSTFV